VTPTADLLRTWGITAEELAEIISENPSARGLLFGFVAEYKLRKMWLNRRVIENLTRPRSHDRTLKCDFRFDYKMQDVKLEVKCLDTPKVRFKDGTYKGTFQCNASDTTEVTLPNGETVSTNCLLVGGFDVLAVCLFAFGETWRFAFALNHELPHTTWRGYTPTQQRYLLKSAMPISWSLEPPYVRDLFTLLDRLVAERMRR